MVPIGRPQARLLNPGTTERDELECISRSLSAPLSVIRRAQIVLASDDGEVAVAQLPRTVIGSKPSDGTHWTVRSQAQATGLSKNSVARTSARFGVQPNRSKSVKLSTGSSARTWIRGGRHPARRRSSEPSGATTDTSHENRCAVRHFTMIVARATSCRYSLKMMYRPGFCGRTRMIPST